MDQGFCQALIYNFFDFPVSDHATPEGFDRIALGRPMPVNCNVLLAFKEVPTLFIVTVEDVFQSYRVGDLVLVDDAPHVISSFPVF